jgi:2-aminoethylphosphonate aminotransferase
MMKRNLLFNPGPVTTTKTVKLAQVVPDICPREQDFSEVIRFIREGLLKVVNADPEKYSVVLFGGSGTLAIEAMISSVVPVEGKLLIINNGAYGQRQKDIADIYHIPNFDWKVDPTTGVDLTELQRIINSGRFTHLSFVHHETTTGLLNPFHEIVQLAKLNGLDVIVDTVSSFAGIPIDLAETGADFIASVSNKCIQGMAGVSFVIGRKEKIEQSKSIAPRSLYLNLYGQYKSMNENGQFRYTPPVQTLYALKQAITEFFEEGGIARSQRYSENWRLVIETLEKLKLELLVPKEYHSKILISVKYPKSGFDFKTLHDRLYEKGFTIYPGKLGDHDSFRIAIIGDLATKDIKRFLKEFKSVIKEMRKNSKGSTLLVPQMH